MSTRQLDIFSTPMVPMLDAAWIRDNLFDESSRKVGGLLRTLQEQEKEIEDMRVARERTQEALLAALGEVRTKRQQDEADNG